MDNAWNSDAALLQGLATGSRDAVAEIYRLYRPMLTKWMITRGGNETDADDVFQETLVVMYEKAAAPEFCLTCKLSTYLFAVSKRIWFKKLEQGNNYVAFAERDDDGGDEAAYEDDILQHQEKEQQFDRLWQAMEKLGEPCTHLLKAFYMEDRSMQDIAKAFSYTNAENAKTQKYKCLMRLKKIFFDARSLVK